MPPLLIGHFIVLGFSLVMLGYGIAKTDDDIHPLMAFMFPLLVSISFIITHYAP